jgi:hypothetical protein
MARFIVKSVFELPSLGHFAIAGDITDGTLKPGMTFLYERDAESRKFKILGVECLDNIAERRSQIALRISLQDIHEFDLKEPKHWIGQELTCV